MRTSNPLIRLSALMVPMSLIAMLCVQCASEPTTTIGTTGTVDAAGNMTTSGSAAGGNTNATMTPAQERLAAATDLRDLRATLVADLEAVRLRLNDGTKPYPGRAEDEKAAADLAQGLARLDLALTAIETATDETWSTTRVSRMQEVQDVHVWLAQYRNDNISARNAKK